MKERKNATSERLLLSVCLAKIDVFPLPSAFRFYIFNLIHVRVMCLLFEGCLGREGHNEVNK